MNRILESNHNVEKGLIAVEAEIKSINDKMRINAEEHRFFREAILALMNDGRRSESGSAMDKLNKRGR